MATQQLRDYFIADRLENLSDDELFVLERDSQGRLLHPDAYQRIVDEALKSYTRVTRSNKK